MALNDLTWARVKLGTLFIENSVLYSLYLAIRWTFNQNYWTNLYDIGSTSHISTSSDAVRMFLVDSSPLFLLAASVICLWAGSPPLADTVKQWSRNRRKAPSPYSDSFQRWRRPSWSIRWWRSVQYWGKSKGSKFTLQMAFIDCNHTHLSDQFILKYYENPLSARSNHNCSFTRAISARYWTADMSGESFCFAL